MPIVGSQQDYGMRIYNASLCKFLSVDPLTSDYPELTPYQFASNTPNAAVDVDGMEGTVITNVWGTTGQIDRINTTSYNDINGNTIDQNLTDSRTQQNYSGIPALIINIPAAGATLPAGVQELQPVNDIRNVSINGTTLTGVDYTQMQRPAYRDANRIPTDNNSNPLPNEVNQAGNQNTRTLRFNYLYLNNTAQLTGSYSNAQNSLFTYQRFSGYY